MNWPDTLLLEEERLTRQSGLDEAKTREERNRLGQFATPTQLACDVLKIGQKFLGKKAARFFDPAFGTGTFYSALLRTFAPSKIHSAEAFEIDPHYGGPAGTLWGRLPLRLHLADFTRATAPAEKDRFNLVVCNPPYVRHHHLNAQEKERLGAAVFDVTGLKLSGLSGFYTYFMLLAHEWMQKDGIAVWLIPSEFMGVNYGRSLREYLLRHVQLEWIHRFDPNDVQFADALVSSAVVVFRRGTPARNHEAKFTFGGSLLEPRRSEQVSSETLASSEKWLEWPRSATSPVRPQTKGTLSDILTVKRGLATGENAFFVMTQRRAAELSIPQRFLIPILPSPRYVQTDHIKADASGLPTIENQLFLLSCSLSEEELKQQYPRLFEYYQTGKGSVSERYLCRSRAPWYSQEHRDPAPFLCSYIGRHESRAGKPFRFILNDSRAVVANSWLMLYPKGELADALKAYPERKAAVVESLNAIDSNILIAAGRVYGGGLHKIEPKELGRVPSDAVLRAAGVQS